MQYSLWKRYISYFLFLTIFLSLLAGCMEGFESEGGMLNLSQEGNFHFQAFVEDFPAEGEKSAEYERMREVMDHSSITESVIYRETEDTLEEYGHLVDGFPTYILIDHNGIAVNTSDIEKIADYIESHQ